MPIHCVVDPPEVHTPNVSFITWQHDDLISGRSQHLTAGGALDRVFRARAQARAVTLGLGDIPHALRARSTAQWEKHRRETHTTTTRGALTSLFSFLTASYRNPQRIISTQISAETNREDGFSPGIICAHSGHRCSESSRIHWGLCALISHPRFHDYYCLHWYFSSEMCLFIVLFIFLMC